MAQSDSWEMEGNGLTFLWMIGVLEQTISTAKEEESQFYGRLWGVRY